MALPIEQVNVTLSYNVRVTTPAPSHYPSANQDQVVERLLSQELVKRFQAKDRRLLLELPFKPQEIISNTGEPNKIIKDYLTRPFTTELKIIPGPFPIPILIQRMIEPVDLIDVVYMYVGPYEHRVIYIYNVQLDGGTPPVTISAGAFQGEVQAMISWAQPIADLIQDHEPLMPSATAVAKATPDDSDYTRILMIMERISILEETAKAHLHQHGG